MLFKDLVIVAEAPRDPAEERRAGSTRGPGGGPGGSAGPRASREPRGRPGGGPRDRTSPGRQGPSLYYHNNIVYLFQVFYPNYQYSIAFFFL